MARVVLTQPQPRVEALGRALTGRGHQVATLSFTRIEPAAVDRLAERVSRSDWVVAVSPGAVESLATALGRRWPAGPALALIGPGSQRALEESGLPVPTARRLAPVEPPFDAAALMRLGPFVSPSGLKVLIVRGESGRDDWIESLRAAGAHAEILELYGRKPVAPAESERARLASWLSAREPVACVFTQSSAVPALLGLSESRGLAGEGGYGTALVIHERIAEAARVAGFPRIRLIRPGEEAIAAAIE